MAHGDCLIFIVGLVNTMVVYKQNGWVTMELELELQVEFAPIRIQHYSLALII